ncbi:MAG TPA: sugar phosphate isomerase/epimerase family protein [Acidobacteriota bacterium]|jgi:sugar phosphate isomerase/epimerase
MSLSRRSFIVVTSRGIATAAFASAPLLAKKASLVRIGVPDWNLHLASKPEALELGRRLGFEGVEVSLGREGRLALADAALQQKYLEESKKHHIPITSTCLDILHVNYLKSDPLGQRWVLDAIDITKKLGPRVILLPFFGKGALKTRAEMDFVSDFLKKEGAPKAEKMGIVLGLENTNSAEENAYMLDRIQSRAVKVYYDVGNSTKGGYDVVKEIRWLGRDRICQFHLKDNPYLLGQGSINFDSIVQAIVDIKYRGWANLETDSPNKDLSKDLPANLAFIKRLLDKYES